MPTIPGDTPALCARRARLRRVARSSSRPRWEGADIGGRHPPRQPHADAAPCRSTRSRRTRSSWLRGRCGGGGRVGPLPQLPLRGGPASHARVRRLAGEDRSKSSSRPPHRRKSPTARHRRRPRPADEPLGYDDRPRQARVRRAHRGVCRRSRGSVRGQPRGAASRHTACPAAASRRRHVLRPRPARLPRQGRPAFPRCRDDAAARTRRARSTPI